MKYLGIFLFSILSFLFLSSSSSFDPEEGLIAYYSFNECDARDDSGNGSNGQMSGGVSCWCGIEDDGLLFNGVNDFVEFQGLVNDYFSTSDFTISFYFHSKEYTIYPQSLLSKRENCEDVHMFDFMLKRARGELDIDVHETETKDFPGLETDVNGSGWHHVALVRRGIRAYTYINGQAVKESRRCSGVDLSNDALLSFSNSPCLQMGVKRFKGVLDELRVYDYALTPEDIEALYRMHPIESAEQDCVM
jgi:hypothetical protein